MDDAKFEIPEDRDPGEFLNDAELAEFHRRRLDELEPDDPARAELLATAGLHARSAGLTDHVVAVAEARAIAEAAAAAAADEDESAAADDE